MKFAPKVVPPPVLSLNGRYSNRAYEGPAQAAPAIGKQTPDHIVVVVEENHSYKEIVGNPSAPYMNRLFKEGANLANHYAVTILASPIIWRCFRDHIRVSRETVSQNSASTRQIWHPN